MAITGAATGASATGASSTGSASRGRSSTGSTGGVEEAAEQMFNKGQLNIGMASTGATGATGATGGKDLDATPVAPQSKQIQYAIKMRKRSENELKDFGKPKARSREESCSCPIDLRIDYEKGTRRSQCWPGHRD